jgi:hypothetical protein
MIRQSREKKRIPKERNKWIHKIERNKESPKNAATIQKENINFCFRIFISQKQTITNKLYTNKKNITINNLVNNQFSTFSK